ncbi:MAG: PDZ domain-containing protein, partial [Gemmatimonadales bacterium]
RSDHSSVYARGIPVVHLVTDNPTEYHRTGDDAATINLEGIERIARFAADLAERLMTLEEPPVYASVPQPPPAGGGGYGAYLGSIPDMSGSPGGVRLTGVREGSPAAEAGIVGGDIIVRMGEHEVGDLYDMTDALRAYHPGDTIQIDVMRDGERLTLTVTLGRRGG